MGSLTAQLFSGLSRDVRLGSSPVSGWATQGHSETSINQSNVFIKPFLHQSMSQRAIQKPRLKPQTTADFITTTIIVVRDFSLPTVCGPTKVRCHPGAQVHNTNSLLPTVLANYSNIDTIVTHIGFNNLRFRRSKGGLIFFKHAH